MLQQRRRWAAVLQAATWESEREKVRIYYRNSLENTLPNPSPKSSNQPNPLSTPPPPTPQPQQHTVKTLLSFMHLASRPFRTSKRCFHAVVCHDTSAGTSLAQFLTSMAVPSFAPEFSCSTHLLRCHILAALRSAPACIDFGPFRKDFNKESMKVCLARDNARQNLHGRFGPGVTSIESDRGKLPKNQQYRLRRKVAKTGSNKASNMFN